MAESKIQNDQYGLLEDFQKFTGQYFGIGPDNDEEIPENTKLGLFGYINEVAAHCTKVSMFHTNALYNEIALNTASIPETIYSAVADEGVDTTQAVPAKATILVTVEAETLLSAINAEPSKMVKLDRESFVVNMDSVYFHLPFSVYIRAAGEGVIAMYNSMDFTYYYRSYAAETQLLSGTEAYKQNAYIEAVSIYNEDDGKRYIQLRLDVFQYEVFSETHDLAAANLSNSINFQVDLEDQLASFTVFYKEEDNDFEPIEKYQSRSLVSSDSPYCTYNFIDENSYQVMFDLTTSGWRPANGSVALVKSCTTIGSEGNFNFSGDMSVEDPNLNFAMTGFVDGAAGQPSGGKDRPTIQELKQAVYEKRLKTEVLSTPDDLNVYFAKLSSSIFKGVSKAKFERSIDDLITRLFKGYLLLGDTKGRAFPTNTALQLLTTDFPDGVISASDPIIPEYTPSENGGFVESKQVFRSIRDGEELADLIDKGHHVYFTPFVIQKFSGNNWRYFDLTINELLCPYFKKVNADSESNPVLNYLKIRRSIQANPYGTEETLSPNESNKLVDNHVTIELATTYVEKDPTKVFLVVLENKNNPNYKLGVLYEPSNDSQPSVSNFCQMVVNREFIQGAGEDAMMTITHACKPDSSHPQKYWLFNMVNGSLLPEEDQPADAVVKLEENVTAKIYILEYYAEMSTSPYGNLREETDLVACVDKANDSQDHTYDVRVNEKFYLRDIFDTDKFRVKAVAAVDEDIHMFQSMDDVFASSNKQASAEVPEGYIMGVPLVGAEVAYNDLYYEEFIQVFKSYLAALKDSLRKLVNNTEITVKFYNTYGPSNKWKIRTTTLEAEHEELEDINSSDIEIKLDIERENGQDDEVEAEIKKITENFFKELNSYDEGGLIIDGKISMTKLTTAIEKAIPSISAANVISINDVENPRFIVLNPSRYAEYPEYINVGMPINPESPKVFPENVRIKFHYTF